MKLTRKRTEGKDVRVKGDVRNTQGGMDGSVLQEDWSWLLQEDWSRLLQEDWSRLSLLVMLINVKERENPSLSPSLS